MTGKHLTNENEKVTEIYTAVRRSKTLRTDMSTIIFSLSSLLTTNILKTVYWSL